MSRSLIRSTVKAKFLTPTRPPPQFFPQDFLGRGHFTTKFTRALKFFFGDVLTWDDVLDWHNEILPLSRLPQGGEAKTPVSQSA